MKIFGIQIGKAPEKEVIQDQIPEITNVVPDTKKPALIPSVRNPVLNYHSQRGRGRGAFQPAEYNLSELGRIEDTDSYVRQAFDKKVGLLLKEGWDIVGPNPRTVKYIKARLAQIARASEQPTEMLIRSIASGVVRKSNTFLLKVRKTEASGGKIRNEPGSNVPMQPVAAYFVLPSETIEFSLASNKIVKWRQLMPDGEYKEYMPRDIVHFFYDRKEGFIFGTPTLTPVIDDIRALRKIEENLELLIYQHLFPLFHYKIGTEENPAGITETGEREIDVVRREIMYMPTEGGIVTPERHEIKAIGAEGRALRAEGYVDHFKKRVFSGLGVSAVDMGEGETANRATADNMSRNMVDGVKDFQKVIEIIFKHAIIDELLLESTFGNDVLDEENKVELKFKEIDIEAQIKKQAHYADQFAKDIITHDEARIQIGLEPIEMPDPEESQAGVVDPNSYPAWYKTRWKMFKEPELLIQSIDEPYSPAAIAATANNSAEITKPGIEEAGKKQNEQEIALEKEKTKAKVAVAKAKPKPVVKKKDAYIADSIHTTYNNIANDTVFRIGNEQNLDMEWVGQLIRAQMGTTISELQSHQILQFRNGYKKINANTNQLINQMGMVRGLLQDRADKYITRITEHLVSALKKHVKQDDSLQERQRKARVVFNSLEFRTKFIDDFEPKRAFNLGFIVAAKDIGATLLKFIPQGDEPCDICVERSKVAIPTDIAHLHEFPPHHPGCMCIIDVIHNEADPNTDKDPIFGIKPNNLLPKFTALSTEVANTQDSVIISDNDPSLKDGDVDKPDENLHEDGDYAECPKCGNTAIQNKTSGMYRCNKCNHTFQRIEDDEEVEDGASLEECVKSVKGSLRKQHPDWDADKIKSSAFAICSARKKK